MVDFGSESGTRLSGPPQGGQVEQRKVSELSEPDLM